MAKLVMFRRANNDDMVYVNPDQVRAIVPSLGNNAAAVIRFAGVADGDGLSVQGSPSEVAKKLFS